MRTLSLITPILRNDKTNLRSDYEGKMTGLSLAGTGLARRYKILERMEGDSFKAHDLALDQTVTVRQAMPTSPRDGDAWCQKIQQLVLIRNPNFLNVLDVVFDKWSGFVITERARGRSIGVAARAITFVVGRCFAVNNSFSRLPRQPLFVKMDVWELVRPSKNIEWPFLSSKAQS